MLLHGWPSSVWEFTRLAPLLAEHARVIVPSLPGYTFSFTPGGKRASIVDCADGIHGLMTELGHERYHVAGGDWGASIAVRLAHAYPEAVEALHLYMMPLRLPQSWPESEGASREELKRWMSEEGGYIQIQGTRPQTLAYGLSDSPVGLMSWIGEKFERWTDARGVPDDDLLTTVMIYWVTGCIGSSFWPYWARKHGDWVLDEVVAAGGRIAAPLTYLDFPKELVHVPRAVVELAFDIARWETPEYGGHFPALEATESSPTACGRSSALDAELALRAERRVGDLDGGLAAGGAGGKLDRDAVGAAGLELGGDPLVRAGQRRSSAAPSRRPGNWHRPGA